MNKKQSKTLEIFKEIQESPYEPTKLEAKMENELRRLCAENYRLESEVSDLRGKLSASDASNAESIRMYRAASLAVGEWREFLERLEWSGERHDRFGEYDPHCPDCGASQDLGHKEGCQLAAMLGASHEGGLHG